jgi:hypothetical protein
MLPITARTKKYQFTYRIKGITFHNNQERIYKMRTQTILLALLVAVIVFVLLTIAVEVLKSEEKPKVDTLLTLSIPAVDKRINEYKSAINYAIQIRGEAQKTIEQTNENIKTLQTAITVLESMKVDSVMKVQKKK